MADAQGEVVDGDELLYVIAKNRFAEGTLVGGVVGTLMTNLGLEHALAREGIAFRRAAVGDRYVMEMLHSEGWQLGGESSGHIICLDRTTTGDAIVSALQVLHVLVSQEQTLHAAKSGMVKYPQVLINVPVSDASLLEDSTRLQGEVDAAEASLNGRGRVLLRASGTEPLVRVMVEGDDGNLVRQVAEGIAAAVNEAAAN
jgi:phosphoglucosamine mutase